MKITSLEFLRLLPEFMREDAAVQGLAKAVEAILKDPAEQVKTARVWDQIDSMTDEQLDELAYELDIDWYSTGLSIESKRAVIKSSDKVYAKRGTKWAVEQVIKDVFGGGYVTEWKEYGGKPFHFRVTTSYMLQSQEIIDKFRELVGKAKRCSAVLDTIEFAHSGVATAYSAMTRTGISIVASATAANV